MIVRSLKFVVAITCGAVTIAACGGEVDWGTPPVAGAGVSGMVADGVPGGTTWFGETGGLGGTGGLDDPGTSGGRDATHTASGASGSGGQFGGGSAEATGGTDVAFGGGAAVGGSAQQANSSGGAESGSGGAAAGNATSSAGAGAAGVEAVGGDGGASTPDPVKPTEPMSSGGASSNHGGKDDTGWGGGCPGGDSCAGASSAGGTSATGAAGTDVSAAEPCGDTPLDAECVSESQVRFCAVPTGEAEPTLIVRDCTETEVCVATESGAGCVPRSGECAVVGDSNCLNDRTLRVCDGSRWESVSCPGECRQTALGGFCLTPNPTTEYSATLLYEARGPDETYTNWSATSTELPVREALVVSFRNDKFVDAVLTNTSGAFTIDVPSPSQAGDQIFALLLQPNATGTRYRFAIGVPNVRSGYQSIYRASSLNAGVWSWRIDPLVTPSGSTQVITQKLGSGAVHLFDVVRRANARTEAEYGTGGRSVVVWLRMNTAWEECGACFLSAPALVGNLRFEAQVFIPATAQDQAFWSEPLIAHELGHWAMWSYGVSPREGGTHCLGVPTYPGQAWSEGWATGFSSMIRDDPVFYDKQSGTMFWINLANRTSLSGAWTRPAPDDGLLQLMDENEVGAMVWGLASDPSVGTSAVYGALASPRMTLGPFARGYTRHSWTMDGCIRDTAADTGESVPMVADFLDALVCNGASASAINALTEPTTFYPYPSSEPLCLAR